MKPQARVDDLLVREIRQLVERDDPAAANQLRNLLFDVRRGAREADGPQAVDIGYLCLDLDLTEDAATWLRHALDRSLNADQQVSAHIGVITALFKQSRFAEALRGVPAPHDLPPGASAQVQVRLALVAGETEQKMGLFDAAIERYTQAERLAAGGKVSGRLLAALEAVRGSTLNALGRNEEAASAYRRALETRELDDDARPEVLANLANALRDLERYDEAEQGYREAISAAGNQGLRASVLSNYGRLLAARGSYPDATAMLKSAYGLRRTADPAGAAITAEELAKLSARQEDFEGAGGWAATAIALRRSTGQPDDPWLGEFAARMSAVVTTVGEQPGIAAAFLIRRLRAVLPGEWTVIIGAGLTGEVAREAISQLSGEPAPTDPAAGRAVEDRWLLELLGRVLAVGPDLALAEHAERLDGLGQVVTAARDVLEAEHWLARKRRYESRRDILETPAAADIMATLEGRAAELDLSADQVAGLRRLVRQCQAKGVDVAFAELPEEHPMELVNRFLMVGTWRESREVLKAHPELADDEIIARLEGDLGQVASSERARLAAHIEVLRQCRVVGLARAFEEAPSVGAEPLGTKMVRALDGVAVASDEDLAEVESIIGVARETGDAELLRLASLALIQVNLGRAHAVLADSGEMDPATLERAALAFAQAGEISWAQDAWQRAGDAWLGQADGDQVAAMTAAASAYRRVLQAPLSPGEQRRRATWLGLGAALWGRWKAGEHATALLVEARDAFQEALDASPTHAVPLQARQAARGLHDVVDAFLGTSPLHRDTVLARQFKVTACRTAIAATDQILSGKEPDESARELSEVLWAYQGAVTELCALGAYGAALAVAEHGRARGFLAEIAVPTVPRSPGRAAGAEPVTIVDAGLTTHVLPPDARELTAFLASQERGVVVLAWYATATEYYAFLMHGGSGQVRGRPTGLSPADVEAFALLAAESLWQRPAFPDEPLSPAWPTLMESLVPQDWHEFLDQAEEVILVPHGDLAALPLHALPVSWLGQACLLDKARVRYLPGLAIASRLHRQVPGGDAAVVMGYGGTAEDDGAEFEREARLVAETVGSDHLYLGGQAQAARIFALRQRASLIHLAAHAQFDDTDPLASGILLADGTGRGSASLTARDVIGLRMMPGPVVVLSGCETGRHSRDLTGESYGLARAFIVAGARAVVASQWRVDSPATGVLMAQFHRDLHESGDVARSLRAAALALRASPVTSHPYYWAAFIAIGA